MNGVQKCLFQMSVLYMTGCIIVYISILTYAKRRKILPIMLAFHLTGFGGSKKITNKEGLIVWDN